MLKFFIFLQLFLVACVSCSGTVDLAVDPSQYATKANYSTAEFRACGGLFLGLAVCPVKSGQKPPLQVQGYYEGSVFVAQDSISKSVTFSDSELVSVDLDPITQPTLVTIVMTPVVKQSTTPTGGFGGAVYYFVEPTQPYKTFISKFNEKDDPFIEVSGLPAGKLQMIQAGCGTDGLVREIESSGGKYTVKASDIKAKAPDDRPCIINGGFKNAAGFQLRTVWLLQKYQRDFVPLELPDLNVKDDQWEFVVDTTVAFVALDKDAKIREIGSENKFEFDQKPEAVFRMATVKGRSVLGVKSKTGGWTWKQ